MWHCVLRKTPCFEFLSLLPYRLECSRPASLAAATSPNHHLRKSQPSRRWIFGRITSDQEAFIVFREQSFLIWDSGHHMRFVMIVFLFSLLRTEQPPSNGSGPSNESTSSNYGSQSSRSLYYRGKRNSSICSIFVFFFLFFVFFFFEGAKKNFLNENSQYYTLYTFFFI